MEVLHLAICGFSLIQHHQTLNQRKNVAFCNLEMLWKVKSDSDCMRKAEKRLCTRKIACGRHVRHSAATTGVGQNKRNTLKNQQNLF